METQTIDVRGMIPRERHPRIFEMLDSLSSGQVMRLVNDHDPKPLYYQLQVERPGQTTWEYVEEGPEVWQVLIGKATPAGQQSPAQRFADRATLAVVGEDEETTDGNSS